jgi:hypothetical protein
MKKTVYIAYRSSDVPSTMESHLLCLKAGASDLPTNTVLASQLMSSNEEKILLEAVDRFIMTWNEYIPQSVFSHDGVDLSPLAVLDTAAMLTDWFLLTLAVKRFLDSHSPNEVVISGSEEVTWFYDLVSSLVPNNIKIVYQSPSFKQVMLRKLAPLGTRFRGMPISNNRLPENTRTLIVLQNAFTDLTTLKPVINALANEKSIVLATDPQSLDACVEMNIKYLAPGDFGKTSARDESIFARSAKSKLGEISIPEAMSLPINLLLPLRSLFLKHFPYLPNTYAFQLHRFYSVAERALRALKPKLVILAQDVMRVGRAFCYAAKKLGIPTICLQHGVTGSHDHGYLPVSADKLGVWGKWSLDYLKSRGADESRLFIAGSTATKVLMEEKSRGVKRSIVPDDPITVFTNPSGQAHHRELFDSLPHVHETFPERRIQIKLHPAENYDSYKGLIHEASWLSILKSSNNEEIMKNSACIIVYSSGTGLDAMIDGYNVAIWNYTGFHDLLGAGEFGAVPYASRPSDLPNAICEAMTESKQIEKRQAVKDYLNLYMQNYSSDPVLCVIQMGEEMICSFD